LYRGFCHYFRYYFFLPPPMTAKGAGQAAAALPPPMTAKGGAQGRLPQPGRRR